MGDAGTETLPIRSAHDVVRIRQAVRRRVAALGFGLVDQSKVITAASELARNALDHGGGAAHHPAVVAGVLHRHHRRGRDDATVLVVRVRDGDGGGGASEGDRAVETTRSTGPKAVEAGR